MAKQQGSAILHRNYIQYLMINHKGKEYKKECVCVYTHTHVYVCVCNYHFAMQQ